MKIIYATLPGRDIYNGTSPEHLYVVIQRFRDKWWTDECAQLRALVVKWFRELYEINTGGHYSKLRESVLEHGFQNPIIVTAGEPLRRPAWQLPPTWPQAYLCEANGGSRLALAQELDMDIPCIINGDAPGEELRDLDDVRSKFTDKTYDLYRHEDQGVLSTPRHLSHLGRYTMAENQKAVRKTIKQLLEKLNKNGY
jgi:hypothetical protein